MMTVVSDGQGHDKGSTLMTRRTHAAVGKGRTTRRSDSTEVRSSAWGRGGAGTTVLRLIGEWWRRSIDTEEEDDDVVKLNKRRKGRR